jgi:hypothetical protein
MDLYLSESDDWYDVVDDVDGCVVARFLDYEDARWYINNKKDQDDD